MANLHPAHPGVWFDHAANALKHRDEPRLRASMPAIVYEHLAYWTCSEPVKMLWRINVFRKGVENNVDIWANDKAMALSKMITLLQRADSFNAMWVLNMFGVSGNGNVLMTFKFDRGISVERMHAVVASWYGSTNFNLFHLGFEISDGLLVDHGVEPGSLLEFRRAPAFLLLPSDAASIFDCLMTDRRILAECLHILSGSRSGIFAANTLYPAHVQVMASRSVIVC